MKWRDTIEYKRTISLCHTVDCNEAQQMCEVPAILHQVERIMESHNEPWSTTKISILEILAFFS